MKLNYKRTFFIGFAFLSISAFWQLYENIIPLILKNTFGFKETVTGTIIALDNVLALFLLPIFGNWSDKTKTRLGKRTPYIIVGTIIASFSMILIPTANQQENLILFIVALGIALLAMGSYRSPAVALMPDLTPKPLRSKANAVINLMGAVGGIYALIMTKLLVSKDEHPNYFLLYCSVIVIMVLAVCMLVLKIRENKVAAEVEKENKEFESEVETQSAEEEKMPKPVRRSFGFLLVSIFLWFTAYNAVTTAFSRYAQEVWNLKGGDFADCMMIAMAAAIVSFMPIGFVSSKIGRKKTIMIGIILMTFSYFCGCFFVEYSPLINLVFVFTGIGWASINVNSYPMVVEMSQSGNIGKYTGIYYTFSMAAQIFTPIFSGILLDISYRTLFPYAVFFSAMAIVTMSFVKHGDSVPIMSKNILDHCGMDD